MEWTVGSWRYTQDETLSKDCSKKLVLSGWYADVDAGERVRCAFKCSKSGDKSAISRESNILHRLKGHPHIVNIHSTISDWGGEQGNDRMVLELIEPLGYDLVEAWAQAQYARQGIHHSLVHSCILQLVDAIQKIHSSGIVHRGVRPDNVLLNRDRNVKLLGFGAALDSAQGDPFPVESTELCAPELANLPGNAAADCWGIGLVLLFLITGEQLTTTEIVKAGRVRACLDSLGADPDVVEAIEGLLNPTPNKRWTLDAIQAWAAKLRKIPETPNGNAAHSTGELLERWPYQQMVPQAFGVQLPASWEGSGNGNTIGELGLIRQYGLQVLLILRGCMWRQLVDWKGEPYFKKVMGGGIVREPPDGTMEIIQAPIASTGLRPGDWIFFGVKTMNKARRDEQMRSVADVFGVREVCAMEPQFDSFAFPAHCQNAVLGQRFEQTKNRNALHLRFSFGLNIGGVAKSDGSVLWWPGADVVVNHGDRGLVMRVPKLYDSAGVVVEPTLPSHPRDLILGLHDEARFRAALNLQDEAAWTGWQENMSSEFPEDASEAPDGAGPAQLAEVERKMDLVAAGHASRGGSPFILEHDAYGIPRTVLKELDEAELEILESLWGSNGSDPILVYVPKFEGIITKSNKRYMRMSYLLRPFRRPKVMDLKLGLRTFLENECDNKKLRKDLYERMCELYPDEVTDEDRSKAGVTKLRWMTLRDKATTVSTLGFRIDGVGGSKQSSRSHWKDKVSRISSFENVCTMLEEFADLALDDDGRMPSEESPFLLLDKMIPKLREMRDAFKASPFVAKHECIGSSLLLVADAYGNTGVFWIDFAKTRPVGDAHITHDRAWVPGNHEDGLLLGLDNLISAMETVAKKATERDPIKDRACTDCSTMSSCLSRFFPACW
mmetsp:Transcript_11148/g.29676  ORF Transcript_11148/g.29676 Transcript_11148/m.29676 type:complete len:893 (-) Transcript_11148:139-2817(-)